MKKKRSVGVTAFGIIGIILSLSFLINFNMGSLIWTICFLFLYFYLLKLKNWARLWLIIINGVPVVISIIINILFLFSLSGSKIAILFKNAFPKNTILALIITIIVHFYLLGFLIFFTRSKVKEQFR